MYILYTHIVCFHTRVQNSYVCVCVCVNIYTIYIYIIYTYMYISCIYICVYTCVLLFTWAMIPGTLGTLEVLLGCFLLPSRQAWTPAYQEVIMSARREAQW